MDASRLGPKSWWVGALIGAALGLLVVLPLALGAASAGEGRVYDLLLRTRLDPPDPRVVLVVIDDDSVTRLRGQSPTRDQVARAVARLWNAGASLVGIDILFRSPHAEAEDAPLEATLSKADVVLAFGSSAGIEPIPRLAKQAVGLGAIDLLTDPDGVLRSLPPPFFEDGKGNLGLKGLPFALEVAQQVWFPKGGADLKVKGDRLWIGTHAYPVDRAGWLIPFAGGEGTLHRLSFADVLDPSKAVPDLKGKIILLGNTTAAAHDLFPVPIPAAHVPQGAISTNTMAGVEVHGQALSALLRGASIERLSGAQRGILFALLAVLGTVLLALPLRPVFSVPVWLTLGAALLGGAVVAMRNGRAVPLLALGIGWLCYAGASLSYHWYRDFQEKKAVQRLFARYVSPNVARELLSNPDLVQLGGRRKTLTILFSDIRGFTNLSERIPPEQVSALLNEYFTVMTQVLFRYDGTLDKFIGDAVLAFFGDPLEQPDQSARALACAVAMQEEAAALRAKFEAEGKPQLHIGISVHTGPAVVGNNGSETNFLYTVIGDTVNLTARLQGLAVKDDVITTVETAERIPGLAEQYRVEELDPVMVKGKSEPIPILRVVGRA
jgi:adenylate cyclase